MHHDTVAFLLHLDQKFAYPPVRNPHSLGRIALRHYSLSSALQPFQPIPFLLAHRDSFHPSSLSAVNRNFLLCPIRNFSLCRDTLGSSTRRGLRCINSVVRCKPVYRIAACVGRTSKQDQNSFHFLCWSRGARSWEM